MRWPILLAVGLLASGCNRDPATVEVERMKQQVIQLLREFNSAEFADIHSCPSGQGYSGTITAGNGNGGRGGPFPFIVVGTAVAIDEDRVAPAQRIQAGSYQMGRFARLHPRCFGESDEVYRSRYRTQAMDRCLEGARSTPDGDINANQNCACVVDSYMRDTSSEQLKADANQPTAPARVEAARAQCAQAARPGGTPTPENAQ